MGSLQSYSREIRIYPGSEMMITIIVIISIINVVIIIVIIVIIVVIFIINISISMINSYIIMYD